MEKRIGIYVRVSTVGQNTELQIDEIQSYLLNRGFTDWILYEDKMTGTNDARPALRAILRDARTRKIDIVICWKLDRLFRSLRDLLATIQELQELRVDFISVKDQIDLTTATGRLMLHLIAAFAEFEASLIKERVNAGLANAKRKGIKLGRPTTIPASEVLRLRQSGLSLSAIARTIGVTKSAVSKTLKKLSSQAIENIKSEITDSGVDKTKDLETPTLPNKKVNYD